MPDNFPVKVSMHALSRWSHDCISSCVASSPTVKTTANVPSCILFWDKVDVYELYEQKKMEFCTNKLNGVVSLPTVIIFHI